jgi:hypothetical protein
MAAGGIATNIELGPGRLYVAPIGTAEPTTCSTALPSAWRAVGYTQEGSALTSDKTMEAVEVAEELDPLRYVATRRMNTLVLSLAEMTRRNLALVLAQGAAAVNDSSVFNVPDPGAEIAVMGVWDSIDVTDATNVRWLFRQMKPGGALTIPRRKGTDKALLPVTFNLEKPTGLAPWSVFPNASGLI